MKIDFLRNAYRLIHPLLRKKGIGIVLLLVASSVLDFFSLAFFLPLIFLLIDPTTLQTNAIFQRVYFFFGSPELTLFAAIFTFFVFVFIVLKVIVNSWIILKKAQYAYRIGRDMASLATNRFLNLPYEEFTHADLSNEVNLISNMPLVFANNIIIPMGTLLSETLLFAFLLLLVALYNIQAFALLLVLLVPVFIIYQLRRKKIKHIASSFRDSYPSILKHTIQITEGLPDIRSYVKEASFKDKLEKASKRLFEILALDHTLNASIPRLIEVAAAGVVCTIIGYTLLTKHSQQDSLMLLSLYAGASFRLVPSINRILASIQQIKVHEYSVKEFMRILKERTPGDFTLAAHDLSFVKEIRIQNISFGYPGQKIILDSINLIIPRGQKVALTGKSGTGKTSFLLLLLRFLKENEGSILVDGKKLNTKDDLNWRHLLGYVPQNPYILDGTILENIAFGVSSEAVDVGKVKRIIYEMDLADWVSTLENGIQTSIGEKGAKISGGQRQRIAIARALYHQSEILLLDEVTNQLDPQTEKEVINTLLKVSDQNKTIIMITHHPDLLKKFDVVYRLKNSVFEEIDRHETKLHA